MLTNLKKLFQTKQDLPTFTFGTETFPYLELRSSAAKSPALLIGLHGFGSDETQLETLLDLELNFPYVYLAPRAWYTLTGGGYAWFPLTQDGDTFKVDTSQHHESMTLLESFITVAVKHYQADPTKVCLVGYSQGASLSLSYFLHKPETLFGAVALSGALLPEMKPDGLEPASFKDKPLFVGHGTLDALISEQDRTEIKTYVQAHAIDLTYREYRIPHVVSRAEKREVELWLGRAFMPANVSLKPVNSV